MAPGAASGVSAGAGWLLGKHQPHALKEEEGGSQGGGEQGTPIPPARSTAGQARSCRAQGWGWCLFQLQTHRPLQCPPMHRPKVPSKPPQSQPSGEGESLAAARRGAHQPAAWLGTVRPWGAAAWGERPWQGRGGMRRPKKFSS